jgi:hypothetical protein
MSVPENFGLDGDMTDSTGECAGFGVDSMRVVDAT